MSAPRCPICNKPMVKNGRTSAGKQRRLCKGCGMTKTNAINSDAKRLERFLRRLLSKEGMNWENTRWEVVGDEGFEPPTLSV